MAVATNNFDDFVDKLVNQITIKDISKLSTADHNTNISLHYAATVGNTKAAKALVEKDHEMPFDCK
ncbi:unnamed protein product [Rhodiola kirilowii]